MNTTMKLGSVVLGVDGSAGSEAAVEWAVTQAVMRHRPLVVVSAGGDPAASAEFVGLVEARRTLRMAARRVGDHVLGVVRHLAPDLDVEVTTPVSDPRTALLELADRASLIVVGTRGRGPVRTLLLGSVSGAVAAHATCPVAVVRPASSEGVGGEGPVVVGVDGGPSSTAALEFAFDLASTQRRVLDAMHTWNAHDTFVDDDSRAQRLDRQETHDRLLNEALAGYGEKYPDVEVRRQLLDASPVHALVSMSEGAAAVVVGSRGRTGVRAALGSVSRSVLERAHSTVVVVRP